jgi:hypothetical protein
MRTTALRARWCFTAGPRWSRLVAIPVLAALAPLALVVEPLVLNGAAVLVTVALAAEAAARGPAAAPAEAPAAKEAG